METTWVDRLRQEGFEAGVRQGTLEGKKEGRQEGEHKGKQDLLLTLLERRFGQLPVATRERVLGITSSSELARLATRVLDAPSLDDLGL